MIEDEEILCKLQKDVKTIEDGIESIMYRYKEVCNKLAKTSAYTNQETIDRMQLIMERKSLSNCLRYMGIQDFEIKSNFVDFKIRL
ncbi:hypothetical protein SDC9_132143 [bioreactor metagenome]|uniref:Uncharacterized protein n=1 Tax=bioreactor metagenome TaxID=1076179 RepID=A0A645D6R3_9ZZZZ